MSGRISEWIVENQASGRFEAYLKGQWLLLPIAEGDTEAEARRRFTAALSNDLSARFIRDAHLPDDLETRALAARFINLAGANDKRTVTDAETAALARKLHDCAHELRNLIANDDRPVLRALLQGSESAFLDALDRLKQPAAVVRGKPPRGSRRDLLLSYLVTAWREVHGTEPSATDSFVRVAEAVFGSIINDGITDLRWTRRALKRLTESTPSLGGPPPQPPPGQ